MAHRLAAGTPARPRRRSLARATTSVSTATRWRRTRRHHRLVVVPLPRSKPPVPLPRTTTVQAHASRPAAERQTPESPAREGERLRRGAELAGPDCRTPGGSAAGGNALRWADGERRRDRSPAAPARRPHG